MRGVYMVHGKLNVQLTADNSNLQGKSKEVRVIGDSSSVSRIKLVTK